MCMYEQDSMFSTHVPKSIQATHPGTTKYWDQYNNEAISSKCKQATELGMTQFHAALMTCFSAPAPAPMPKAMPPSAVAGGSLYFRLVSVKESINDPAVLHHNKCCTASMDALYNKQIAQLLVR